MKSGRVSSTCFHLCQRMIALILALAVITPDLSGKDRTRPADELIYASQLVVKAQAARERRDYQEAERCTKRALDAIAEFRSTSPTERDTAAVLKADTESLHQQIRLEQKVERRDRRGSSVGARVAKTIVIMGILGGAAYVAYNNRDKFRRSTNTYQAVGGNR